MVMIVGSGSCMPVLFLFFHKWANCLQVKLLLAAYFKALLSILNHSPSVPSAASLSHGHRHSHPHDYNFHAPADKRTLAWRCQFINTLHHHWTLFLGWNASLWANSLTLSCFLPLSHYDSLTWSSQWRQKHPSVFMSCWSCSHLPRLRVSHFSLRCHIFQSQGSLRRASPKSWPTPWRAWATSALMQTRSFLWTSWRSTRWPWTGCTCSTTQTWCWQTPPQRTHSGWTGCNADHKQTLTEREKKKYTNMWMERNKGQDEPDPLLHGFPAVRPRPRFCEALRKDAPPKRGGGGERRPGNGHAVTPRSGALRFLLACCVYSVPSHATYIQKKCTFDVFFFSFHIHFKLFFSLIYRHS